MQNSKKKSIAVALLLSFTTIILCNTENIAAQNASQYGNTQKEYFVAGSSSFRPSEKLTLWYTQPATTGKTSNQWMEYSLPIGNGQFGASLFGGIQRDEIQFNEPLEWHTKRQQRIQRLWPLRKLRLGVYRESKSRFLARYCEGGKQLPS